MGMIEKLKAARKRAQSDDNSTAQGEIPKEAQTTADGAILDEIRENIQAQIAALRQLDTMITKYVEERG